MRQTTVVGAGVAGLTIAHQLAEAGYEVTVVEANDRVGGLARTFHYGGFHFDVGPHRFHTENARTAAFIRRILGEEAIEIPRRSGAQMFGRIHEWPLRPGILAALPLPVMLSGARDLIWRERLPGESFAADVISKYGRTLHDIFFEPYTRKFLFHSAADLHRDWARAGVNRAIIDRRAQADSLVGLLKTTLLPGRVDTTFLYPPHGVGRFADILAERIRRMGGRILLGAPVTAVESSATAITGVIAASEHVPCATIVWTAPLTHLNRALGIEGIDLRYLSTIFFNLEIDRPPRHSYQWIYFGGREVFSRVTAPEAFQPTTTPPGTSGLCAEVTCMEGDARWLSAPALVDRVVDDLLQVGMLESRREVRAIHVERVANTYPIYRLNYPGELSRNLRMLGRFENLLLAGRCGRFWYNNMDHSIGQGLTMIRRILIGESPGAINPGDREFWEEPGVETGPGRRPAPARQAT